MEIKITGRGTTVTDSLRSHAQEKIADALKVFDIQTTSVDVVLRVTSYKNTTANAQCEVTVRVPGSVIRVAAASEDMYAAIDEAARLVTRKMRKYKTRVIDRRKHAHGEGLADIAPDTTLETKVLADEKVLEDDEALVRSKFIEYTKYTEEDALVQADLLGHDFFVFTDMVTGNVHVIYHRKNGGYGILKPITEE
jgi:putative sigma-54 modulation protein